MMTTEDLGLVAKVHKLAFPESFLTRLGKGAVERYYRWQIEGPHDHYLIVAFSGEEMAGFCVGGISRGALSGFLEKNKYYLGVKLISKFWLLFKGNLLKKFRIAFVFFLKKFLPERKRKEESLEKRRDSFGILSICVIPQVLGLGIAQKIMQSSEIEAIRRGFGKMHLTVDAENHRAIRFYEKLGYVKNENRSCSDTVFMEKFLGNNP